LLILCVCSCVCVCLCGCVQLFSTLYNTSPSCSHRHCIIICSSIKTASLSPRISDHMKDAHLNQYLLCPCRVVYTHTHTHTHTHSRRAHTLTHTPLTGSRPWSGVGLQRT